MTTITIRELHAKTGRWVRKAAREGEILVTDRGHCVAKIVPQAERKETPYFGRRKVSPAFKRLSTGGKLRGGTDSTRAVSEDREDHGL
ncbi:MAG TPA: type II toxin-antitoxin system prevent-host-death family antitoxin [Verrucomicrobiae bacterium]|nr:type II toxin-antitoxin system prevent-host-death family antitoxin [Verrucomicrobiae bacterium]